MRPSCPPSWEQPFPITVSLCRILANPSGSVPSLVAFRPVSLLGVEMSVFPVPLCLPLVSTRVACAWFSSLLLPSLAIFPCSVQEPGRCSWKMKGRCKFRLLVCWFCLPRPRSRWLCRGGLLVLFRSRVEIVVKSRCGGPWSVQNHYVASKGTMSREEGWAARALLLTPGSMGPVGPPTGVVVRRNL